MKQNSRKFLVWLLSLCMVIMPLSGIAHSRAISHSSSQDSSLMPCHQLAQDTQQQICPETGKPGCDCCDFAIPAGLTSVTLSPDTLLYVALIYQESVVDSYLSQTPAPPYRPPRLPI